MTDPQDTSAFARLARKMAPDSILLRARPLHGGVSARVTAIELQHADGQRRKLIVRQHGAADLARNPQVAADEFALLRIVHDAGVSAPAPYYLDESGEIFETPVIVLEYIEGETVFALADAPDLLPQFARQLAAIHQIDRAAHDISFLPDNAAYWGSIIANRPARLDDSLSEGRIRDALEAAWPWTQLNTTGLLHGDYWPGNILWHEGRLVGIVDWEDAAIGDPLADIAISRLDLLWAFGADAMERFTREYAAVAPIDRANLAYWDLCAALRPAGRLGDWASDEAAEARMRERHALFVAQALERLSSQ
ncbi:MAG TPA: phosphotransferase [Ktedonobacterales bacterium]|nr:phosphotransferase [Ktedonobacterales bacterium]